MLKRSIKKTLLTIALIGLSSTAFANGAGNTEEPIEYLIKFDIEGTNTGFVNCPGPACSPVFTIGGPGYATITTSSGEILDDQIPGLEKATLSNAQITFTAPQPGDPAYVNRFTCLSDGGNGCRIEFTDGSVLVADTEVLLEGRLIGGFDSMGNPSPWGFVPSDAFDPMMGIFPQRIMGCGGLIGIEGPLAGTVGSICFNGTFNVPVDANGNIDLTRSLTGGSNCTITLHHPTFPQY